MKALIEKFQKGLDEFMKNEFWRDLYESAPDGAKRFLEGEFDASTGDKEPPDGPDPDAHLYLDHMKRVDWEWLAEFDSYHPRQKAYFLKMAREANE